MYGLGDLEAVVMDAMWDGAAPATVRQVFEHLSAGRPIAYTTVLTVMDNLYRKGFLAREMAGRAWSYRLSATREEHLARLMRDALDEAGDQQAALTHFVSAMTEEESRLLRGALRRRRGKGPGR
jgi:predicted transcriptional regulator